MVETGNRKPFLDTEVEVTIEDILKESSCIIAWRLFFILKNDVLEDPKILTIVKIINLLILKIE